MRQQPGQRVDSSASKREEERGRTQGGIGGKEERRGAHVTLALPRSLVPSLSLSVSLSLCLSVSLAERAWCNTQHLSTALNGRRADPCPLTPPTRGALLPAVSLPAPSRVSRLQVCTGSSRARADTTAPSECAKFTTFVLSPAAACFPSPASAQSARSFPQPARPVRVAASHGAGRWGGMRLALQEHWQRRALRPGALAAAVTALEGCTGSPSCLHSQRPRFVPPHRDRRPLRLRGPRRR
eukprot:790980-Rhodomonas_salina.1